MSKPQLYIGLMSGTSVDGIDAALVSIQDEQFHLQHFISYPIPELLKHHLLECNHQQQVSLRDFSRLHSEMGMAFAQAVKHLLDESQTKTEDILAIGSHGQTIFHTPDLMMSLQIGHPALIAKQTGITTIADFRIDDLALGGQGAPFAPVFHQALFAEKKKPVAAVNIGGIANISLLPALQSEQAVTGWDTGPGNGLMDEACQRLLGKSYDANGDNARQGIVHRKLLDQLLQDSYFDQTAPKSSGRDYFNWAWLESVLNGEEPPASDLLATLCELTAITIAEQIPLDLSNTQSDLWICGGGAFNPYLIERIQAHLPKMQVQSSLAKGHNPDAIEAMLFAWLAHERLHKRPVKLSAVTGASRDAVLGGIWHP